MLCVIRRLFTSLNVVLYTATCQVSIKKRLCDLGSCSFCQKYVMGRIFYICETTLAAGKLSGGEVKGWNELKMQENISRLTSQCRRSHAFLRCVSPPLACTAVHYNKGISKPVVLFSDHPEEWRGCAEALFHLGFYLFSPLNILKDRSWETTSLLIHS